MWSCSCEEAEAKRDKQNQAKPSEDRGEEHIGVKNGSVVSKAYKVRYQGFRSETFCKENVRVKNSLAVKEYVRIVVLQCNSVVSIYSNLCMVPSRTFFGKENERVKNRVRKGSDVVVSSCRNGTLSFSKNV